MASLTFFHHELSSRFCACTLDQWEEDGQISREAWLKAGEYGLLGVLTPEKYGGVEADILYSAIVWEEQSYSGCTGPGFALHSEIVAPYLVRYGTEEQKERLLPKLVSGEFIGALGMTEPSAGSDFANIKTVAKKDGDDFIINGSKVALPTRFQHCRGDDSTVSALHRCR